MSRLTAADLIPGAPVVTVNRAMTIVERGLTVDFAAFADGPGGAWQLCNLEKLWTPAIVLWVSMRPVMQKVTPPGSDKEVEVPGPPLIKFWDRALPASAGFRLLPWGDIRDEATPEIMRAAFTTFCAFRRILEFSPKKIRILCMDMAGSWIEGMSEEECHAYDMERTKLDRWTHERTTMQRAIDRARSEGIVVEQIIPQDASSVNLVATHG
jgi:hypothetical protein